MNFNINASTIETLIILKGLRLLEENEECHELDKACAQKLREKIYAEIKRAYKENEK